METPTQETHVAASDFVAELRARGFQKGCGTWQEYECGKEIINHLASSSEEYDRLLQILVNYLEV